MISKTSLIDRLWDDPPSTARNLIEKYVSMWRKALDDGQLETVGPGYRLNLDARSCDLIEAEQLIARARAARAEHDTRAAAVLMAQAVTLFALGFEEEAASVIPEPDLGRLVELYLRAVEDWTSDVLMLGDQGLSQVELLTATHRRHPIRERTTELLMWCLARQGLASNALDCFERTRRALADELGQDPGEALKSMHLRVLRQDAALQPGAAPISRIDNLPPRNDGFVGREAELDVVGQALTGAGPASTVAVFGLVGAGKSALALEFAQRRREQYDCIWWIDASTSASAAADLESLASRLGRPLPVDREPNLYLLWDALRGFGRVLLVFDDASSAADLSAHLPPTSVADVVITSLNPEWRRAGTIVALDVLSPEEAVTLLQGRLGTSDSVLPKTLAAELGHLPLALSQAAAYIDQTNMPPAHYLALFRRRRAQLLQRGVPDDHRNTLDTVWRLAQAELAVTHPAALQLLELCSLLAPENIPLELVRHSVGLMPAELADAVEDEVGLEDAIREVRRYSLLSRDGDRLHVHCLVQTVVASSLPEEQRLRWIERAAAALAELSPPIAQSQSNWQQWEAIVPHVREIVRWALDRGQADDALIGLAQRCAAYLAARASYVDAVTLMNDAQVLIEATAPHAGDASVGRGLTQLGELLEQSGRLKDALRVQQDALAILRSSLPPDDPWVARALGGLTSVLTCHSGVSLWQRSELPEAQARFEAALDVLQPSLGERHPVIARILSGLGQVLQDRGDLAGGQRCQERALALVESLFGPDHPEVGHTCDKLGYVLAMSQDFERSRACYERAAAILSRAYGAEDVYVGWSYSNLANLLNSMGETQEAYAYQQRAHAIFVERDEVLAAQISEWRLACIHLAAGRYQWAYDLLVPVCTGLEESLGDGHADVLAARIDLDRARDGMGRRGEIDLPLPDQVVDAGVERLRTDMPSTTRSPVDTVRLM